MCHSEFPYAPCYETRSLTQLGYPDNSGFPQVRRSFFPSDTSGARKLLRRLGFYVFDRLEKLFEPGSADVFRNPLGFQDLPTGGPDP